ncbi:MAG: hypothetical protein NWF05_09410 [Candidatus Bathyarchaeota archaeon]|nr:hypothetical protein [Candidatus Bathyarchaeota archaeon]
MRQRIIITIVVSVLVLALLLSLITVNLFSEKAIAAPDVYFGVDVGFGDEYDVYRVADAVEGYANLIIIGSLAVTTDTAVLTRVCDYLYAKGFSFIIYIGFGPQAPEGPDRDFFSTTAVRWGDQLLGAYIFDEPGGKQLDYSPGSIHYVDKPVKEAVNVTDAAQQFFAAVNVALVNITGPMYYNEPNLRVFTSDYALYWFDYIAGYNVVLGEFVGNQSRQLAAALCRGAANAQHMEWGITITWKYNQAPFLEDAAQLYDDMVLAYENGAQYIVVFNSPDNQSATTELGILTPEHLDAMRQFWDYASIHPRTEGKTVDTAYVLPSDFGIGFRGTEEAIWGLWPSNATAVKIERESNSLIDQYGTDLDIVYETLCDGFPVRLMYDRLIFWNGTVIG